VYSEEAVNVYHGVQLLGSLSWVVWSEGLSHEVDTTSWIDMDLRCILPVGRKVKDMQSHGWSMLNNSAGVSATSQSIYKL
jgi:hypothetical protein